MQNKKEHLRKMKKRRIRSKISGTSERPRLNVYKSNIAVYAQLIDDEKGVTLASASSIKDKNKTAEAASKVGQELAKNAKEKKIKTCVFDRNAYKYHGVVKSLADSAREGGLVF